MPIEIRELVIKATVSDSGVSPSDQGGGDGSRRNSGGAGPVDLEAIVKECVRQVLAILARDAER
jgi:hypothetical protein